MTQNGHPDKWDWIRGTLGRYEGELLRYAQRLTGDVEAARDVVQETFLRLCREEPAKLDGHLGEWLFTVCRNKAFDVRRKERRMTTVAETRFAQETTHECPPAELAERRDSAGRILDLVDSLPDNQQEVIRLKFQNGLSYKEISGVTGLSVSNVGFLLHVGLKAIRRQLCPADAG